MKVICSGTDLKNAVTTIIGAAPVKAQTPILNGILLTADDGQLTLDATDFAVAATARIIAETEIAGSCLVNAKVLFEVLKKIPLDVATLTVENDQLVIKADATKFELPLIEMEDGDFPTFTFTEPQAKFVINPLKFKSLIAKTVWACTDEKDGRPIFQGVSFKLDGDILRLVATNTHRLVRVKYQLDDTPEFAENARADFIVPATALNILDKMLTDRDRYLNVEFTERAVKFTHANFVLYSRLIDGTFPDPNRVFPENFTTKIVMEQAELLKGVERVKLIAKLVDSNCATFTFTEEGLELTADATGKGKALEHLNADVTGADITIAFNAEYVADFLKASDDEKLILQCNEPLAPAVLVGDSDDDFEYVITPIRI